MNKLVKLSFILAAFAFFAGILPSQTNAQGLLTKIVRRMEDHRIAMKSLKADIKMVKRDNNLAEEDTYKGIMQYIATRDSNNKDVDALVRLDWASPKQESISIINREFLSYDAKSRQAFLGKSDSKKVSEKGGGMIKLLASPSKDDIVSKYDVKHIGDETVAGGVLTWHLKLTPKTKADYQYLDLWVDINGMPIQGRIVSLNSDTQTISLSDLKKNVQLRTESFVITIPKGIKITKV
jgi:outer membrane lipoprotein-sorting protein